MTGHRHEAGFTTRFAWGAVSHVPLLLPMAWLFLQMDSKLTLGIDLEHNLVMFLGGDGCSNADYRTESPTQECTQGSPDSNANASPCQCTGEDVKGLEVRLPIGIVPCIGNE